MRGPQPSSDLGHRRYWVAGAASAGTFRVGSADSLFQNSFE